jgi:hypothetical protein
MNELEKIRALIACCSDQEQRMLLSELQDKFGIHSFEKRMNAKAEVILEALDRAPDLTIRGIRGIIGEATFAIDVVQSLQNWKDITPAGNHSFDTELEDSNGRVKIQVKMQRRVSGHAWIRNGKGVVEVQRTRTGTKGGKATRPYTFGTFDILAVCMEPSHGRWNTFLYVPESWLLAREEDASLIQIMQPVPLQADEVYTDNFDEAVNRARSGMQRPTGSHP